MMCAFGIYESYSVSDSQGVDSLLYGCLCFLYRSVHIYYLLGSRVAALLINLLYSLSAHAAREHEQQRECKQNLLHNIVQIGYCSFYSWGAATSASSRYLDM